MIGTSVFPGMVTESGDLVILAVQRRGADTGPGATTLAAGDVLLVQGEWTALEREIDRDREVLAVDDPVALRRQAVPFMAAIFVLTAVIGSFISNTATALIVIPIAVAASAELDVSARPVLMAVTVSASAAFMLPITTPANLMVMGPDGYRFGDDAKFGLPLLLASGLVGVFYLPVIWPL